MLFYLSRDFFEITILVFNYWNELIAFTTICVVKPAERVALRVFNHIH
ncbi:MAG: hypothetical protein ACI8WW_001216, partial [Oceanospirillaceae bacterium]